MKNLIMGVLIYFIGYIPSSSFVQVLFSIRLYVKKKKWDVDSKIYKQLSKIRETQDCS